MYSGFGVRVWELLLELCLYWCPHWWNCRYANGETDVNYQVMSAKDLVDSVFTLGGWSNFLVCSRWVRKQIFLHNAMVSFSYLFYCLHCLVLGEKTSATCWCCTRVHWQRGKSLCIIMSWLFNLSKSTGVKSIFLANI